MALKKAERERRTLKILITGQNSYIGNAFEAYATENQLQLHVDKISLRNEFWKRTDFSQYDSIFHVAGIAHNKSVSFNSKNYWDINYDLTLEVAELAKAQGVKQFIYMSSIIIYGPDQALSDQICINVDKPSPKGIYAESKYAADQALQKLESEDFKVSIIRSPMVYGPGCKGNFPKLIKLSQWMFMQPIINNQRSMVYIDHLLKLVHLIIQNLASGIFYPQETEYLSTSIIIETARQVNHRKIRKSGISDAFIKLISFLPIIKKIYGNKKYSQDISHHFKGDYRYIQLDESLKKTIQSILDGGES